MGSESVKSAKALYSWLALIAFGISGSIALHYYRLNLYEHNSDYVEFRPLQRVQYELFWVTVALMVAGAVWHFWVRFRK
jgi:hypothetical protein